MKNIITLLSCIWCAFAISQNSIQQTQTVTNCALCTGTYTWNTSSLLQPSVMISGPGFVRDLQATNYAFNIPLTSTITGINVSLSHSSVFSHTSALVDTLVSLIKGGAIVGANKNNTSGAYTASGNKSFGGPGDLWGTTWVPSEINAVDFGFNLKLYLFNVGNIDIKILQGFVVTVYYLNATGIKESQTKNVKISSVNLVENKMYLSNFEKLNNYTLQIFDLTGKSILSMNPKEDSCIDLTHLNSGIYFYKITSDQENRTQKFILLR